MQMSDADLPDDTSAAMGATGGMAGRLPPDWLPPHERLTGLGLVDAGPATEHAEEIHGLMLRTPLFAGLGIDDTRKLSAYMRIYDAQPGITLINEGEPGDFMLLLVGGMIDVLRRNRYDYPARIALGQPGHALGEMSMFDGEPRFASCVTLEPCRMAVLSRDALMQVLEDEPALGNRILLKLVQLLSDRLRQTSSKLVSYLEAARDG